jgi:hypothetical protein
MTPFPSEKVVEACAAVITWRNALLRQAIALSKKHAT